MCYFDQLLGGKFCYLSTEVIDLCLEK